MLYPGLNVTHVGCRAWQLFDWVRGLPEEHPLKALCDVGTYTTMIMLCGTWQQLRRALELVDDMRARSLDSGLQVHKIGALTQAINRLHISSRYKVGALIHSINQHLSHWILPAPWTPACRCTGLRV